VIELLVFGRVPVRYLKSLLASIVPRQENGAHDHPNGSPRQIQSRLGGGR